MSVHAARGDDGGVVNRGQSCRVVHVPTWNRRARRVGLAGAGREGRVSVNGLRTGRSVVLRKLRQRREQLCGVRFGEPTPRAPHNFEAPAWRDAPGLARHLANKTNEPASFDRRARGPCCDFRLLVVLLLLLSGPAWCWLCLIAALHFGFRPSPHAAPTARAHTRARRGRQYAACCCRYQGAAYSRSGISYIRQGRAFRSSLLA